MQDHLDWGKVGPHIAQGHWTGQARHFLIGINASWIDVSLLKQSGQTGQCLQVLEPGSRVSVAQPWRSHTCGIFSMTAFGPQCGGTV